MSSRSYLGLSLLVGAIAFFLVMGPVPPKTYTAGQETVVKFEGAFNVTKQIPPPGRCFLFQATIKPHHPRLLEAARAGKKPPTHFHPTQEEYLHVQKGSLTVEVNDVNHEITAKDGEFTIVPGVHHCLYATPGQPEQEVSFFISAAQGTSSFMLDQAYFENWYGYQEDMMLRGTKPDVIQVLSMFDAGETYLSLPQWVPEPFRHHLGYWAGVVIGRWLGGILGYQPFYPEWTTDWDAACDKMETVFFQKRFAKRGIQESIRQRFLEDSKQRVEL